MQGLEEEALHEVMVKLGVLMNKYRVIPKSYFKDAVIINFFNSFINYRIEQKLELSQHLNFHHIYHF